ncbi:MAG TPA: hypothetical protein VKX33_08265 [Cyclobacteriaceae bacterium]|nr:hypothetical protein [Cyclobacteriaceae bacterium]
MRLIIATLTALCLSIGAQASSITRDLDNPNVVLEELGDKKIQLKLLEIPEGKVLVTFKNKQRNVIFKDVITSGKFTKKNYDLNSLASGEYSVEVYSKEHGTLENFELSLESSATASPFYSKTKVVNDNDLAFLVKTLDDTEKTIKVFHKGRMVHQEEFTGTTFGKVFKFEKVSSLKDIHFEVTNKNGYGRYVSSK